jgi:predicted phage baseplate assembly protein
MSDLRLKLDDTTFEDLVELGRSLIPSVAPDWTDHNVHDPGIMLLELVAWTADAQIYSLGRMRRDERVAYARLLGVEDGGPQPARGRRRTA